MTGNTGPTVRLRARRGVIVAASAVQTPGLLRRSGLRNEHIGRHFQAHPGVAVAGLFDEPVHMLDGATQGAESLQFRASRRFKPETLGMQPEIALVRVPGVGRELAGRVRQMARMAFWAAQVRARTEGEVRARDGVVYTIGEGDVAIARQAVVLLARAMFEAGAKEVWPGIFGMPTVLRSIDDVQRLERASLDARAYLFAATHYFGTARMGRDAKTSAVGTDFRTHEVEGLYVVDTSVFPTNLGVNPQHTVMAMSRLAATRIAAGRAAWAA